MLYQRLFSYAPRSDRNQLENFLTASICDLLVRMMEIEPDAFKTFMKEVLLKECPQHAALIDSPEDFHAFSWTSNYYIDYRNDRGWVDLCLQYKSQIILFVENKINADFTIHGDSLLEKTEKNQLEFYDSYLSEKAPDAALVLLTHVTGPPVGFQRSPGGNCAPAAHVYKTAERAVCRWSDVQCWLSSWSHEDASPSGRPQFVRFLAGELAEFLENKGMNLSLEYDDFQALYSVLSRNTVQKLDSLFQSLASSIGNALGKDFCSVHRHTFSSDAWGEPGVLGAYAYYGNGHSNTWYVGWGFLGKSSFHGFDGLPDSLMAFVIVDYEGRSEPIPLEDVVCNAQDEGWRVRKDCTALLKISTQFQAYGSVEAWFKTAASESGDFVNRAQATWKAKGLPPPV